MKLSGRDRHDLAQEARQGNLVVWLKLKMLNQLAAAFQDEVHSLGDYLHMSSGHKAELDLRRGINLVEEVRQLEIELISYALKCTRGHQRQAARLLGLKATTLNAKLKLYRISPRNLEQRSAGAEASGERSREKSSSGPHRAAAGEGAYQEITAGAL